MKIFFMFACLALYFQLVICVHKDLESEWQAWKVTYKPQYTRVRGKREWDDLGLEIRQIKIKQVRNNCGEIKIQTDCKVKLIEKYSNLCIHMLVYTVQG